jgi:hypothetical protein
MTMSAIRTEVAPGEFVTTGVLIAYDSFSPARRASRKRPRSADGGGARGS